MDFILSSDIDLPFDTVLKALPRELNRHGFACLAVTRLDKQLQESLGIEYKDSAILHISNLQLAYKALLREEKSALIQFFPLYISEYNKRINISTICPTNLIPFFQGSNSKDDASVLEKKLCAVFHALNKKSFNRKKRKELILPDLLQAVA